LIKASINKSFIEDVEMRKTMSSSRHCRAFTDAEIMRKIVLERQLRFRRRSSECFFLACSKI
jgi:hypothetical protein